AKKSSRLNPQLMGALLGAGLAEASVYKNPRVKIICTGDELVVPPTPLKFGEVYFLVGQLLKAQCANLGLSHVDISLVGDDQTAIEQAISHSLDADVLLLTGGMSAGERDLVRPALQQCGVQEIFYQGAFRPGKPLFFGRAGSC